MRLVVELRGLDELKQRLDSQRLLGAALRIFFVGATSDLRREAMARVPVDTGHLRRSHAQVVDPGLVPRWGAVGTNVPYGIYVHEGTRPHWPPVAALAGWARRHGVPAAVVARAIAHRGTRPQPWLRTTLETVGRAVVERWLRRAADAIVSMWRG